MSVSTQASAANGDELNSDSHLVALHSFHEEVWDPQGKEQVSGPLLFFPGVLLQVQKVKHVRMPRLQVHGERTGPLSTVTHGIKAFI